MSIEKFVVSETVKLGDDGQTAEFTYSDIFDSKEMKSITLNPDIPGEMREKCARRLYNVKQISHDEYVKLLAKLPQ